MTQTLQAQPIPQAFFDEYWAGTDAPNEKLTVIHKYGITKPRVWALLDQATTVAELKDLIRVLLVMA